MYETIFVINLTMISQCVGVEVRTVAVDKKVLEELEKEVKKKSPTSWVAERALRLKRFRGTH